MTIGKLCSREVDLADATETIQSAARRMRQRGVGSLLVLDDDKKPIGILTDRDLAMRGIADAVDASATPVSELMTRLPRTVHESTPIEDALDGMQRAGVRRLPVVGDDGELVGIVSIDDILLLLADEMGRAGRILERSLPETVNEELTR